MDTKSTAKCTICGDDIVQPFAGTFWRHYGWLDRPFAHEASPAIRTVVRTPYGQREDNDG